MWLWAPGRVEVEERQIEASQGRGVKVVEAMRGGKLEVTAAFLFAGQENRDPRDEQRLRQTLDDGVDQGAQVGLRVERPSEVDESLAIVETPAIEDAVDARLDGTLQRVEGEARNDDGREQAPGAQVGQARVNGLGEERDDAKVEADQGRRRQGVGDAALEDEVDVHEAVADDSPGEREWQKDEAEPYKVLQGRWARSNRPGKEMT